MRLDSRGCGKTHKGTRFVEEGRFGAWGSSSIEKEFSPVQVVQLEEISDVIPVLPIRSDGLIRSLGRSAVAFTVSGKSWYPEVYELTAAPVHKIQIWTSPEGLLLAADRPRTPKSRSRWSDSSSLQNFKARQRRRLADPGGVVISLEKRIERVRGQKIQ